MWCRSVLLVRLVEIFDCVSWQGSWYCLVPHCLMRLECLCHWKCGRRGRQSQRDHQSLERNLMLGLILEICSLMMMLWVA